MNSRPTIPPGLVYDPYDQEIDKDPYPVWKRLRDEAPLYYNEQYDFYALSRYEDVYNGLQNWEDYSSVRSTVLELINPGPLQAGERSGDGNLGMMIFSDPPGHDIARRLVNQNFSPKAVQAFEARARSLCQHFFEQVEGRSEFDLVEDIIRPIPPMMIGHILGVPEEDQAYLGRLVDESLSFDPDAEPKKYEGSKSRDVEGGMGAVAQYLGRLVEERLAEPRDDLITMLMNTEVDMGDGAVRRLDLHELMAFFGLLQAAGSETTARALAWAGVLLARHPEQRQKLVDDPGKIRNAVEELLRYEPPTPIQARLVTRDVEWYGVTVPEGSKMALLNGSAGRDERQYPDPDKFDVERQISRHLSFGYGTHVCLGASLARLEMRVVIEELLKRYPVWHVDESSIELVHTTTVRGPSTVPVSIP